MGLMMGYYSFLGSLIPHMSKKPQKNTLLRQDGTLTLILLWFSSQISKQTIILFDASEIPKANHLGCIKTL